jgi:hypothetical protein
MRWFSEKNEQQALGFHWFPHIRAERIKHSSRSHTTGDASVQWLLAQGSWQS